MCDPCWSTKPAKTSAYDWVREHPLCVECSARLTHLRTFVEQHVPLEELNKVSVQYTVGREDTLCGLVHMRRKTGWCFKVADPTWRIRLGQHDPGIRLLESLVDPK
jgi:hypothetical protein